MGQRKGGPRELRIGKNGVTPGFLEEIKEQLEQQPEIKIKLPRGLEPDEREAMAKEIAEGAGAELVDRRGNTATLRKA